MCAAGAGGSAAAGCRGKVSPRLLRRVKFLRQRGAAGWLWRPDLPRVVVYLPPMGRTAPRWRTLCASD
ncbi:hypothetical protein SBRY_20094 [Actinacidiphila bryophytorum]|uniref:Uncharacterized protein n=1 Tax=Actinacidiphila bryophytorum TaxID=1436133 RepID=A0A9W4E9B5_9ACTN|nr:hypothetical protein SBRY_20094 [Actinacidiphila bryophytorum]